MPELPEVETVRAGLELLLGQGVVIRELVLQRGDLRAPIPRELPQTLRGATITGIRRRAKYLLFDTTQGILLSHLGMTGTWRLAPPGDERSHDHCYLHLADGRRLAFRDPRRFGLLDLVQPGSEASHPRLKDLGPEPLDETGFTVDHLLASCRGRRQALKPVIMDQQVVVGVGNIYAQEALFRAGIRPTRAAGRMKRAEAIVLVGHIRTVLAEAIAAGGSTISDFRQAGGDGGYFQHHFQVYDRAGQPCAVCGTCLTGAVVGGRGTTWCRRCQR
ncbi:MAG: bifunctional DNA-formamidopyrimidine glycosylase/DNA-(apurinic or apyrimidinic site) lyase [Planctomycetes bacterium]|nr:bifunctional DNA-formamidopyrimidine glycosylase/DNA-(apurinic or apyrimidinic site) lyase [Planctomycetota bacterium]